MERCPTCGAAVRAGAKFCTSCGTRLDEVQEQETLVATPAVTSEEHVTPDPDWSAASGGVVPDETKDEAEVEDDLPEEAETTETPTDEDSSWARQWPEARPEPADSDSPADRFRSGLGEETSDESSTWAWGEKAADSWRPDTEADEGAVESATIVPEPGSGEAEPETGQTAASVTENVPGTDPRQHASALLDEVRGLIWQIGTGPQGATDGQKNTIQNISRVRGETSDFADLEPVIAAVREHPRDLDALLELGQKADRLQALLESHARLVRTLEDAIGEG